MLIKCRECGGQVSTEAKRCPHCGCKVPKLKKPKSAIENNNSSRLKNTFQHIFTFEWVNPKLKNVLRYIFTFEWVNDVGDFLADIPIIGGFLSILFSFVLIAFAMAAIPLTIGGAFALSFRFGIILMSGGIGVISWFASYRWGMRKQWFFVCGLICSIAGLICAIFADFP